MMVILGNTRREQRDFEGKGPYNLCQSRLIVEGDIRLTPSNCTYQDSCHSIQDEFAAKPFQPQEVLLHPSLECIPCQYSWFKGNDNALQRSHLIGCQTDIQPYPQILPFQSRMFFLKYRQTQHDLKGDGTNRAVFIHQCCAGRATVTEVTTVTEPWPSLS
ncbi:hypothetical protein ARMGADRAFT_127517 [Armillaria gallica]|uniref:Uncharacterized protein n=1 Tax=Armillaria gallica TaxID=47427 RepID=A0A2H3DI83_ARMGA|nr:hypothetical protein ARMGADRAFT_127517 [Armillaria gallica]